jgi:hypothetical protein
VGKKTTIFWLFNRQFWPIIGKLCLDRTEPFDIEFIKVTQSFTMSTLISHFRDGMLKDLINDGFHYNGCHIKMKI